MNLLSLPHRLRTAWQRITAPSARVTDPDQRRAAQALTSLLAALLFIDLLLLLRTPFILQYPMEFQVALLLNVTCCVVLIGGLVLARRGQVQAAVMSFTLFLSAALLVTWQIFGVVEGLQALDYLLIPIVIASLFVRVHFSILLAALQVTGIVIAVGLQPLPTDINATLLDPLTYVIVFTAIMVFAVRYFKRMYAEQRGSLVESESRYRAMNEDLSAKTQMLDSMLATMNSPILLYDREGHILYANQSVTALIGQPLGVLLGTTWNDNARLSAADKAILDEHFARLLLTGESMGGEITYPTSPRNRLFRYRLDPIRAPGGVEIIQVLNTMNDITDLRLGEQTRLKAAVDRERLEFVRQMMGALGHYFRNALSSIESSRYLVDRMLQTNSPDHARIKTKLDHIDEAVGGMTQQLDNLHVLATLTSSSVKAVEMSDIVSQAVSRAEPLARRHDVRLDLNVETSRTRVLATQHALTSAVDQLIANAIQHARGEDNVRMRVYDQDDYVCVAIENHGTPVSSDELPYLFDIFYRADVDRGIDTGGIGLGLSIVKMVADLYGGEVQVTSNELATTFILCLPGIDLARELA